VAETWDSTLPVKFDSISTEPNPFISKQKQNNTGFAWYFPPNLHNTDRAFLRRLHSRPRREIGPSNDWFHPSIALSASAMRLAAKVIRKSFPERILRLSR
jgi:hypothetical protein